jgi:hypothetical protein
MTEDGSEPLDLATSREKYKKRQAEQEAEDEPLRLPVFRVTAKYFLVPIIVAIAFAGVLAYVTFYGADIQLSAVPFSEQEYGELEGAIYNGIFFTVIAGVSSFLILYLVKKRGLNALKTILSVTFLFLGVILVIFFGESVLIIFALPVESFYVLIVVGGVVGFLLTFTFHSDKFSPRAKNVVILIFGVLIGAFMGVIMPTWTTMMILIGISIWDIISVRRGPIKKIFQLFDTEMQELGQEGAEMPPPLSREEFRDASMEIGIGDIAFYSLLASHALISTNSLLVWVFTTIGILIGAAWTLRLIRRNKILPGLPLSIFIGIALYWLSVFINTQLQFLLFFH